MRWEDDLLLARIVAEDSRLVYSVLAGLIGRFASLLDGGVAVRTGVFPTTHLHHRATASPSIRWEELIPEGVGSRERHTVEHTVLVANPVITGRTVLQVVVVAILLEVGPLGSHLRRSLGEDILSLQPMAVILLVDGSNILVKAVERFQQAVFVTQQVGCLTQLSVGLEAAENEDILPQVLRHHFGYHAAFQGRRNRSGKDIGGGIHQSTYLRMLHALVGKTLIAEDMAHRSSEDLFIHRGDVVILACSQLGEAIPVEVIDFSGQPRTPPGAYSKKPSPSPALFLGPVTSMPNFSLIHSGSTLKYCIASEVRFHSSFVSSSELKLKRIP